MKERTQPRAAEEGRRCPQQLLAHRFSMTSARQRGSGPALPAGVA